jgi:hypothetical protein
LSDVDAECQAVEHPRAAEGNRRVAKLQKPRLVGHFGL